MEEKSADERRVRGRRVLSDRREFCAGQASGGERPARKPCVVFEIIGAVIMIVLSIALYKHSGLYDAADSGVVRMLLGGSIIYWFLVNLRVALYKK